MVSFLRSAYRSTAWRGWRPVQRGRREMDTRQVGSAVGCIQGEAIGVNISVLKRWRWSVFIRNVRYPQ